MKRCIDCGQIKVLDEFYRMRKGKEPRQPYCKECDKRRTKESYYKNHERNKARLLKWQDENRELHNEHARNYQDRQRQKRDPGYMERRPRMEQRS